MMKWIRVMWFLIIIVTMFIKESVNINQVISDEVDGIHVMVLDSLQCTYIAGKSGSTEKSPIGKKSLPMVIYKSMKIAVIRFIYL